MKNAERLVTWWPIVWVVYLLCSIALCLGIGQFAYSECDCILNVVVQQKVSGIDNLKFLCKTFFAQNCDLYDCFEGDALRLCDEQKFLASWMESHYAGDAWVIEQLASTKDSEEVTEYMMGYCRRYDRFMCWLDLWGKYAALPALTLGIVLATLRICTSLRR